MIQPDMIPDEVWHTAMSTYHKTIRKRPGSAWQEAIAAALNAWPNQNIIDDDVVYVMRAIMLPLTQEAGDE